MIRNILGAVCVLTLLVSIFAVESGCSQSVAILGQSSCGAQLSIELNTNVVTAGSTVTFYMRITNSSTEFIKLNITEATPYIITNSANNVYQLRDGIVISLPKFNPIVNRGETREWSAPIIFGKNIKSGDYMFIPITRDITTAYNKICTLTSNSLKVKVVKSD